MPSQEELQEPDTSLLIDIVEEEARDGVGRTRNIPPDRPQRPMVTYREDSNFSVSVALATCVHGIWSKEDKTPTSFIVLQCQFHSLRDTYQLRAVRLEWTLTNTEMDKDGRPSNPDISAIGPNIFRSWNSNTAEVEDTEELEGEAGGNAAGIKLGLKGKVGRTESHQQQYFEKVESNRRFSDEEDRHHSVWWRFRQNQSQKSGVVPGCRIAVLVKRSNDVGFDGVFRITEFDAGWRHDTYSKVKEFFGRSKIVDDPVHFNPALDPFGGEEIDSQALGSLATNEGIPNEHAWIWGVDIGK